MIRKKSLFVATALVFVGFFGVSNAKGDSQCYTLDSVQGTYVSVTNYGSNVAFGFAIRHLDGKGNWTGTFLVNEPVQGSPTGARKIVTGTYVGTYTVRCDGTGLIHKTTTTSTGIIAHSVDDFVITQAVANGGQFLATALADAQRTPSAIVPGGVFITRTWTRRPDVSQGD
jgi:hypothetical protein